MVKSTHTSFPNEGVGLHVSAQDALACGIKPGEPAVVEVTVRPHTVQEWIAESTEIAFQTDAEVADFFARCPVPGEAPVAVEAEAAEGEGAEDETRIVWRSAALGR